MGLHPKRIDLSLDRVQRLLGALSAENVGQVLTREMRVDGDSLTIHVATTAADGEPVTRTLTWTRAASAAR